MPPTSGSLTRLRPSTNSVYSVGDQETSFTTFQAKHMLTRHMLKFVSQMAIELLTRLGSLKGNASGTRARKRAPSGGPVRDQTRNLRSGNENAYHALLSTVTVTIDKAGTQQ
ncbi:hypothetical protein NDU88_003003 [Pleurodeles waltl]|uniref:Uncharacterized protein n=1 Tax=Pleurodeles waltl TaxID=8319 RepID=A0AAV7UBB3_PLEWA|nr:hypothetical protein NDU88_003003 [Pleurodeles waltl]